MGTISRIGKEMDSQKENNHDGCPFKLSAHDKESIVWQINSGKLDNAVQAADFINSTLTHPVYPQTVRNTLKAAEFYSAIKKKVPMLKLAHHRRWLKSAQCHENWTVEDWKRIVWLSETNINHIGSDGKVYVWKQQGELLSDDTMTPTVKHRGNNLMVWGCMGWDGVGKLIEVQRKINAGQYCQILEDRMEESLRSWRSKRINITFSRTMTWNTHQSKQHSGLKTTIFNYWSGLHNPLTSIPLNIFGITSNLNFSSMAHHPKEFHQLWKKMKKEWNKISP